jgi:hypothetical protein
VEIKRRLNSGNAFCHSVQNLLSSSLLSKKVKIRIYKTIILNGCETWSPTVRDEYKLGVFENRVLRRRTEMWIRFPALPEFLRSSGPGTESTQPREAIMELLGRKTSGSGLEIRKYVRRDSSR